MPRTPNSKQKILQVAAKLFYKLGYRATGIDSIAKASGFTKATIYHHFKDKDHLIVEALTLLSDYHKKSYERAWIKVGLSAEDKLTILFDEMEPSFKKRDFYGCPFINASSEFTSRQSAARKICESHYLFLVENLEIFAKQARLKNPRDAAEKIASVISGCYTSWVVGHMKDAAKQSKAIAQLIIQQHR